MNENTIRYHVEDAYFRPTAKGNGSALRLELHPAHRDPSSPGTVAGSIFLTLANQMTVGGMQNGASSFASFDWKGAIRVKLDRTDLSHILQVLRGMKENVLDGKGLFHRSATANTVIRFGHQIEPTPGYVLSVSRKTQTGEMTRGYYFFSIDEAFTLMLTIESSMMYICFGIPEVIARQPPAISFGHQPAEVTRAAPAVAMSAEPNAEEELLAASGDVF